MSVLRSSIPVVLLGVAMAVTPVHAETVPTLSTVHTAPSRTAKNSVFLELGGNAGIYSLNYERYLTDNLAARIGAGYFAATFTDDEEESEGELWLIPATVSYVGIGAGSHRLEIGGGVLIGHASETTSTFDLDDVVTDSGTAVVGTATFGYRYAPKHGGFTFRAGFTPLFNQHGFLPWAGTSLGYSF